MASALQQSLPPTAFPGHPRGAAACHYVTASPHRVGGDFNDVFALGPDRYGEDRSASYFGDVCGEGAPAAAITPLIGSTVRTAARHDPGPVAVLGEGGLPDHFTRLLNKPAAPTGAPRRIRDKCALLEGCACGSGDHVAMLGPTIGPALVGASSTQASDIGTAQVIWR
ncbi:SpoIIE family protein phosphatase [Actinomadura sp. KC216]|uniref:SpoIIE family protein phosphatase n=1 Tax=Actinomadura sp. KC216 TaxID=2530370 RepID=UPI001A9DE44D|nr:SpoIIE family protein phosphatase [Actinomadura sp. KC216]